MISRPKGDSAHYVDAQKANASEDDWQQAVVLALERNGALQGSELDREAANLLRLVKIRRRQEARRGHAIAAGDPDSIVANLTSSPPTPIRRPRKPRAPDISTNALAVKSCNWSNLEDYLFRRDGEVYSGAPAWFNEWIEFLRSGKKLEIAESAHLLRLAKWIHTICSMPSFQSWRDRSEIVARQVSLRTAIQEWRSSEYFRHEEYKKAIAEAPDWWPKIVTCAQVPIRHIPPRFSAVVFAATLLNERVIAPFLGGRSTTEVNQRALLVAFKTCFGVNVEDAWILLLLDAIEDASLMRTNAKIRAANLTREEQAVFDMSQGVPTLIEHAAAVLQSTSVALELWKTSYRPTLPEWLTSPLVALLIERYGGSSAGGPRGKMSREGMTMLLSKPLKLAENLDAIGARYEGPSAENSDYDEAVEWDPSGEIARQCSAMAAAIRRSVAEVAKPGKVPGSKRGKSTKRSPRRSAR